MGKTHGKSDTENREKRLEDRLRRLERKLRAKKAKKKRRSRKHSSASSGCSSPHSNGGRSPRLYNGHNLNTSYSREWIPDDYRNPDQPQGPDQTGGTPNSLSPLQNTTNTGVPVVKNDVILLPENRISIEAGNQSTTEAKNDTTALSEEILKAMGKRIPQETIIGPPIHQDIPERWLEVLKKGLSSNDRSEILKKHPIPENCTLISAPKLNPELKAAATEAAITRDIRIASKQERIAGCLTAIGKGLSIALNGNGDAENLLIIEYLCDTGKLLSDLQREESAVRKSLILTGINGPIKEMLQNSDVDEWLCGKNLEEQLKSAKSVERSLKDLKPPPKNQSARNPKNFRAPLGLYNQKPQTATMGGQKYTSRPQKGQDQPKAQSSQRMQSNQPYRKSYQQKDRSYTRYRR